MGALKATLETCPTCGSQYPAWAICNVCLVAAQEDEPVESVLFTPETAPEPVKAVDDE